MGIHDKSDGQLDAELEELNRRIEFADAGSDAEISQMRRQAQRIHDLLENRGRARQRAAGRAGQVAAAVVAAVLPPVAQTSTGRSGPQPGVQPQAPATGGTTVATKPTPKPKFNAASGGNGSSPSTTGPNPFITVIEAMAATRNNFDPHNALVVSDWYAGLGELVEAAVDMLRGHGNKLENDFYLDPAAAAYAVGLADVFGRFREPVAAAHATFERVHADDLERIRNPKPNQRKWDISANQG